MDETLIYKKKYSLPAILCDDIKEIFHKLENKQHPGSTGSGVKKEVKDTIDLDLMKINTSICDVSREVGKIIPFLLAELQENLTKYMELFEELYPFNSCGLSECDGLFVDTLQIQMYKKNVGQYVYHHDSKSDTKMQRQMTFIWYLNDIDIGGETEFWGNVKIIPKRGMLVLFPATWTYIHRGCVPNSDDKYIITGWFCSKVDV